MTQWRIDSTRLPTLLERANRQFIGGDQFFQLLDGLAETSSYPPYNLEKVGEEYRLTIALAGFQKDELTINVEEGRLLIEGKKAAAEEGPEYLHQGIAFRDFKREFKLAEYVVVQGAELKDGLLTVSLKRELPEALKPRTVDIA